MTKEFDMKNLEYARELSRKYKEAMEVAHDSTEKLSELGLDYTARKILKEDPELEFVSIKSCGISYLTDKPVDTSYSMSLRTKVTPKSDGKILVEIVD